MGEHEKMRVQLSARSPCRISPVFVPPHFGGDGRLVKNNVSGKRGTGRIRNGGIAPVLYLFRKVV